MQTAWLGGGLALTCLAVGGFHAVRAARGAPGGVHHELAHAAMALGMAAMFVPVADPLPRAAWYAVFGGIGAWFTVAAVRGCARSRHLVVCAAAMVFMLLVHAPGHGAAGTGPHAVHPVVAGSGGLALLLTAASLVLAAYFAVHAVGHLTARDPAPQAAVTPGAGTSGIATRLRAEPAAHIVTGAAMAVMLLAGTAG